MSINNLVLIGNLTQKPELKITNSGKNVTQLNIAVNRPFSGADGQKEVDFFNITVWGIQAENACKYLDKGRKVGIVGRIQNRSYEANDGSKRYVTDIIASEVEFLSPASGTQAPQDSGIDKSKYNGLSPQPSLFDDMEEVTGDDLPF